MRQIFIILAIVICHTSLAQEGRITVSEKGDVASSVSSYRSKYAIADKIHGYRIRIFFDNSQQARTLSSNALTQFQEKFPGIPTYQVYQNPYFKVSVGNCLTREEAFMLWGVVKDLFPSAFIVREEIELRTTNPDVPTTDGEAVPTEETPSDESISIE